MPRSRMPGSRTHLFLDITADFLRIVAEEKTRTIPTEEPVVSLPRKALKTTRRTDRPTRNTPPRFVDAVG